MKRVLGILISLTILLTDINAVYPLVPSFPASSTASQAERAGLAPESFCAKGSGGSKIAAVIRAWLNDIKSGIKHLPLIYQRIRYLNKLKKRIRKDALPEVIVFGDKHGKSEDLEDILEYAKERARQKKPLHIVGLGDTFDRGTMNKRNWEILKELKWLEQDNPGIIEANFVLGNHDVLLIQAVLLNDGAACLDWDREGGEQLVAEFENDDKVLELALWILQNFKLFHIDPRGYLYVHAGIPVNENGAPIKRDMLDLWQRELVEMQGEITNIESLDTPGYRQKWKKYFEKTHNLFWLPPGEWLYPFIEGGWEGLIEIDEENKERLIEKLYQDYLEDFTNNFPDMGQKIREQKARELAKQNWVLNALYHRDWCTQDGIQYTIKEPVPIMDKLYKFLARLRVTGIVFGHAHLKSLFNLADRIFCVDIEEGSPGHLVFNNKGVVLVSPEQYGEKPKDRQEKVVADKDTVVKGLDEEISRLPVIARRGHKVKKRYREYYRKVLESV